MPNSATLFVHTLSILFGLSSWVAINGLWVETPILVNVLPEGWNLASYITVITQLANIGAIIYSLLKRCFPGKRLEGIAIHVTYLIGILSLVLLIFLWDKVSWINNQKHSVAFLILTFFLATVDCTSSVLYIPFMSRVPSKFLVPHLVGQALSGLIPSFLALAQGVGGNPECVTTNGTTTPKYPAPRFSINVFVVLLILLVLISWIAFTFLSNLRRLFRIGICEYEKTDQTPTQNGTNGRIAGKLIVLLFITEACICCLTNGILSSIQPYSVLYYGNVTYHFVVTLAAIASPLGCFLTALRCGRKEITLPISLIVALLATAYIIASALRSPHPIIDNNFGKFVIVLTWIINSMFFAFARATIMELLRSQTENHRLLYIGGVCTQIGSAIGAFIMFYVVNYTGTFVSFNPCYPTVK